MNRALNEDETPIDELNSAFQPEDTHLVPDFVQDLTGTDPSNQTASCGYDWNVNVLLFGTTTDSW
jgi:hypothetical protein